MLKKRIPSNLYQLLSYFKPYKRKAIVGGVFMLISVILVLPTPLLTMYLIDYVLPQKDVLLLSFVSFTAILIIIVKTAFGALQQIYFQKFNECVIFKIQIDIFQKVQSLPAKLRKKLHTGYLMSRIKDDPERLHSLLVETLFGILKDVLTLIIGISVVFYIHWKLAIVSILLLPFYATVFSYFNRRIRDVASTYFEDRANVSRKIQESLLLHDLFKFFYANKYDSIRFVKHLKKSILSSIKRTKLIAVSYACIGIIGGLGPVLVIWYGIYEIINGNLLLGELIAFNSFLAYLLGPTNQLIKVNVNIQQSLVAWDRIYEYLNINSEHSSFQKRDSYVELKGEITLESVSFSYDDKKIIEDLNINIPAKSTIAIIGKSGCGKTTFASLLTLQNTDYEGSIKIDGIDLKAFNSLAHYKNVSYVPQEPYLFHDTILENIQIGDRKITKDEIINACKMVNIHDFIDSLPNKYETIIDERALNLSIGQKQRIAIARSVVRNPKIIILDEPSSNLDSNTEVLLFNCLKDFFKNRTTIIITHKLTLDINFDFVIDMDNNNEIKKSFVL